MFSNTPAKRELRIAGTHSGKPVTITPQAEPIYHELVKLARRGNHWAQITVNAINQLASGRLHQNNIFIKPSAMNRGGTEEFVMILPGCKVTAEKLERDGFRILHFEADLNYGELIEKYQKPGLYKASKQDGQWEVGPAKKGGKIESLEDRVVAICDSGRENPREAARTASSRISSAPISGGGITIDRHGFDLHYTPGERGIGGLRNYKNAIRPLKDQQLYESALLLAKTMYDARGTEGVRWISEFGGSAVLTQAMKILADQKIQLKEHYVFLVDPTTSPNTAYKAAHEAGLNVDRKFSSTDMLNYMGNRDQLELIGNRLRFEKKNYSLLKASADVIEHCKSLQGAGAFMGTLAATAGLSLSAPASAAAFLTALGAAATTAIGLGKVGNAMIRAWLPKHHDKLKSKF
ncbi:hypothetical protein ACONUD_10900 [Microbulbifer harenosus]|uniref:Uncharacterized protein n=1 Tax=Microbulbifer harenosus TaxID=2576840 RepID=A0ABY2UGQ1_9GAMM|nr:hypothetical protein [Microbulbifer harenosus]TLM76595.1 hypothetical protein FDY93_12775 [Microbulbifer harenosus]